MATMTTPSARSSAISANAGIVRMAAAKGSASVAPP